jgi:hypothetical protein
LIPALIFQPATHSHTRLTAGELRILRLSELFFLGVRERREFGDIPAGAAAARMLCQIAVFNTDGTFYKGSR